MVGLEAREKDFRRLKSGHGVSLYDLFEAERQELYDYLLRMTGQISRSDETVDEVFQAFTEDMLETIHTFQELRVSLYVTARKFNADIWNADTSKLINLGLEPLTSEGKSVATPDLQKFSSIDVRLRSLPPREREILILSVRLGFKREDLRDITGFSNQDIEDSVSHAGLAIGDFDLLKAMPAHPLPERSRQETQNLSIVMRGIKTKPVGVWSPLRILFLFCVVLSAVLWLLYGDAWLVTRDGSSPAPPPVPPPAHEGHQAK
jgi:DNA-directed RNA polymerase specialized sigma24 family protein